MVCRFLCRLWINGNKKHCNWPNRRWPVARRRTAMIMTANIGTPDEENYWTRLRHRMLADQLIGRGIEDARVLVALHDELAERLDHGINL